MFEKQATLEGWRDSSHAHTHACTYTCMHSNTHARKHACTHVHKHSLLYAHAQIERRDSQTDRQALPMTRRLPDAAQTQTWFRCNNANSRTHTYKCALTSQPELCPLPLFPLSYTRTHTSQLSTLHEFVLTLKPVVCCRRARACALAAHARWCTEFVIRGQQL